MSNARDDEREECEECGGMFDAEELHVRDGLLLCDDCMFDADMEAEHAERDRQLERQTGR